MPSPATPSPIPMALAASYLPVGVGVANLVPPTAGTGPGGLQVPVHVPGPSAWQQLSAAATALASFLLKHSQAALLKQATQYCVALSDAALHGMSAKLADPQQQMSLLGKSLLLAAVALMPASQQFCESLLDQLQVQAKALLEGLQHAWYGEAAGYPALDAPDAVPVLLADSGLDDGVLPHPASDLPLAELESAVAWLDAAALHEDPEGVELVGNRDSAEPLWMT